MSVKLKILTQHGGSEQEGHRAWNCKCPLVLQTGDGVARAASHSSVTLAQSSAGWPETDLSSRFLLNCNCPIYLFWFLFSFFLPHPESHSATSDSSLSHFRILFSLQKEKTADSKSACDQGCVLTRIWRYNMHQDTGVIIYCNIWRFCKQGDILQFFFNLISGKPS